MSDVASALSHVGGALGRRPGVVKAGLVALAIVVAAFAPAYLSSYNLNLLGRFLALAILAMGLVVIWGHCGVLSLGQGVFFGLGAYAIAMHMKVADLNEGQLPDFMVWSGIDALPWWWAPFENPAFALLAVVLAPGCFAALFSWLIFHRRVGGTYFALISQALALAFATLLVSRQDWTGGFNGLTNFSNIFGFSFNENGTWTGLYLVTLGLVVASYFGLGWMLRSRFGVILRALRDGENRMRFLGYSPTPYKVAAFTLASMLAGLAGALFTLHAGNISPAAVGVVPSIEMVIWVAVGGRYSLLGAIIGALTINFARDKISSAFPDLWLHFVGAIFILTVIFLPSGLSGALERLKVKLNAKSKAPVDV